MHEAAVENISDYLRSVTFVSRVRVSRSLVLCVSFVDRCLSFCIFSFGHCVVCSSSIFGIWLPLCWLQTLLVTRLTRCVPLLERKLLTLPEHLNSPPVFNGIRVTRSFVLCAMFCTSLVVLFLLAIELSVLLRFTVSDYLFDILKLFRCFSCIN
jgi:ABC-type multidrug transport system fused ATPase/permease subunit